MCVWWDGEVSLWLRHIRCVCVCGGMVRCLCDSEAH